MTRRHSITVSLFLTLLYNTSCTQPAPKKIIQIKISKILASSDPYRNKVVDSLKYLIPILDSVLDNDQIYRKADLLDDGKIDYSAGLEKFTLHKDSARIIDSINLNIISKIIDKYGWLGYSDIGIAGNLAMFMVIQHSSLKIQEKYLPLIKEAVFKKKVQAGHLAMLEDRIAVRKGELQTYGTQIFIDSKKRNHIYPLNEPDSLFVRRKQMNMVDSVGYINQLKNYKIEWNLEVYKKELPHLIKEAQKKYKQQSK